VQAGAPGLIIDLRGNGGGVAFLTIGMGGHLLADPALDLGTMRYRDTTLRLAVNPRNPRYDGPVAVLVDGLSASTSEFFAAGLQKHGRARIFGERTAGMALPSTWEELPNGDRMQFVTADYTDPSGARLEAAGVQPDQVCPLTREALLAGHDPVLEAALSWILSAKETR
jgi:carboxyl-terminal processing protease